MANLSTTTDLVINKLSQAKYNQLCAAGQLDPHQLYFTDDTSLDAAGSVVANVATPVLSSDAANKAYVDAALSNIDLSEYYTKSETSSAAQISNALSAKADASSLTAYALSSELSNYYTKSETSGTAEISNALSTKADASSLTAYALSNDLSSYYTKSETSSANEISLALKKFTILPQASVSRSNSAFTLSANCTNVLQQTVANGNILVLEDYDYDNIYDVELTAANSISAISFEILAHTIVNNVEDLYDIGFVSQLSTLSPNQKYKFSISHEKIHIENDNALRELSSSPYSIMYVGDFVNFYPVVDSFNSIDAMHYVVDKAWIVMPQKLSSDSIAKSRSFELQIVNHYEGAGQLFQVELSSVDACGNHVSFSSVEGDEISNIIDQEISSYQIVFEETTPGNFLVSRKGGGGSSDIPQLYTSVTYAELSALRQTSALVPGQQYRITDYVAMVSNDVSAQSANHPFDLIVVADDVNVLNESARAIQHEGDTYFSQCKLASWKIRYCFDNDSSRFQWAAANGKGVIYQMVDEFNNECPYDFKGIQFKAYGSTDNIWRYTFDNRSSDATSLSSNTTVYNNIILPNINTIDSLTPSFSFKLNCIVCLDYNGNCSCHDNRFGVDCCSITLTCAYNNTFGNNCKAITIDCYSYFNTIGDNCSYIVIGWWCTKNITESQCSGIFIGSNCQVITFKQGCNQITFGSAYKQTKDYYSNITIESLNTRINLNRTSTAANSLLYKNVIIAKGVKNSYTTSNDYLTINDSNINQSYITTYQPKNSQIISI